MWFTAVADREETRVQTSNLFKTKGRVNSRLAQWEFVTHSVIYTV